MGEANPAIRVRCAVAVCHNDRLLLVRQNGRPFWVLPGGTLEWQETLADCARRELLEELDLVVTVDRLLAVSDFLTTNRHVVDLLFLAHYVSGPLQWHPPFRENLDAVCWVTLAQARCLDMRPAALTDVLLTQWEQGWPACAQPNPYCCA